MSKIAMRTTILAVALSVIAMTAGDSLALHRQTPFLLAITKLPGGNSAAPFAQGEAARFVAFHSFSDLLGNGSGGGEIFLFDNEPPRSTSQITNCAFGSSTNASTVSNGKLVLFDSTSDLAKPASQRCKAELPHRQIFRATIKQGQVGFEQLTNNLTGDCTKPRVSTDGFRTVFECTGDLRRNGSSGSHVFLFREKEVCDPLAIPPCSKSQQITPKGFGISGNAEMNLQATKIVFNSNMAIGGPSNGYQQIFLYNITTTPPFPTPERLTNGVGDSTNPSTNQDGTLVVFQSTADLLGTGSTGSELFLLDRRTGIMRQLTSGDGDSTSPSMGGGGRFILFLSTSDFAAGSGVSGGPHLFIYDLIEDVIYQATPSGPGSAGNPIATADTIFFFDSDEPLDPDGTGAIPGRQVYVMNVFKQVPPRALGPAKMNLLPGVEVSPGVVGGSSVRIITKATYLGNPATSYIIAPIGNPASGAGEITMSILGRNFDQEGNVSVPKMTIPPVPIPSFGAICFQQTGTGRGTVDCNGDEGEPNGPDNLDYRTLQDHVTNNPDSQPREDPFCELGCKEGSECPGPLLPPPGFECPRCVSQPGVCADGPRQSLACEFDTECPGKETVRDPTTGAIITPGACNLQAPQTDPLGVDHFGTCVGVGGPRYGQWCDLDSDCPSNCLAQSTCDGGVNDGATCDSDRDCDPLLQCEDGKIDVCQGPTVLTQSGAYGAGDLEITVPMTAKISVNAGFDGLYCTADDKYALSGTGLDTTLRLTTGKATATISDVNYQEGETMGASEQGAPFNCDEWQNNKNLEGGRLVGAVTFLNVPSIPFKGDTILTFRFQGARSTACVGGSCTAPCTEDTQCGDGDLCNGREICYLGNCQPGVPVTCDDGNQCNGLEGCNETTGLCGPSNGIACDDDNPCTEGVCRPDFLCTYSNLQNGTPCDDGDLCTGPDPVTGGVCAVNNCDTCTDGVCGGPPTNQTPGQPGAAPACENNNVCDGIMACDPATGTSCIETVPPLTCVADTNPCTTDTCDPVLGCNWPNTDPCDDGSLCTTGDTCDARTCRGDPVECPGDGNFCNGIEICNPLSGACEATDLDCDDGNVCTDDSCDDTATTALEACVHVNNALACDDTNACTENDTCSNGQCIGALSAAAATCNAGDGDACTGVEVCNPATGACEATPLNCDDANPCTTDSCDPIQGCQHVALSGLCDDGNACTVGDTCVPPGICLGAPTQVALTCGDGDACNGIETCDPGTGNCVAGTPLFCDDGDECTSDTCDPVTGCSNQGQAGLDGALCEIDAMIEEIRGRPFDSIQGKRLPRKLVRLSLRARVKVEFAQRAANRKAIALLTASDKKLQRVIKLVTKGFGLDRINEIMMHQITDRARDARTIIQGVKANLR
jgi:Tol biopolymer transport system component